MGKNKSEINMCSGALLPAILRFALPLMASSILQLIFNATDIIVVGRFAGENSLAAVGSNTSLINLMTNLFLGLATGTNVLVAQYIGAGNRVGLKRTIHTSLILGVISGLMLTVLGLLFAGQILKLMSTPAEIINLSALYLRVYFIGMPAMMVYNFGSAIMRAKGDTKRPLYYLSAGGVLNVILDLVFVIIFKMDVLGVAIATVVSQFVSAALILRALMHEKDAFRVKVKDLKLNGATVKQILRIGIPAGIQGVVFSLSNVVIQSSINSFGATVMAGSAAAANLEGFVWVAMNAFNQAALTFTGQNVGAGKYSRINKIMITTESCEVFTGLILGVTIYMLYKPLLGIYSNVPEVIAEGHLRLKYICLTYFMCGLMDCIVGSIRGMGAAIIPTIVSLLGACGLRLVWVGTIFQIPQFHTLEILYLSYPVSWIITFAAHLVFYIILRRKFPSKDMVPNT